MGQVEVSHYLGQFSGKFIICICTAYAKLTHIFFRLRKQTEEKLSRFQHREKTGVVLTQRSKNPVDRLARNMRKQTKRQQKGAARRQNHPELPYDPTNPYDTPTPPSSMPPPETDNLDDNMSIRSSSTYAGHMPSIREPSILSIASSIQDEGSLSPISTPHASQMGRKRQLRQGSVDILASQVFQAREQTHKIQLENQRKRAELERLKAEKESRELDQLLILARQEL
jgi:hypothetical protein